jgi:hypothetical protein
MEMERFSLRHHNPVEFGAASLAIGDFNNDGNLDLAVVNGCGDTDCTGQNATVSILLGNGDGTFQSQKEYAVGLSSQSIVTADFNGDGNLDLAVTNTGSGSISILLGNGDGTFQPQIAVLVGHYPTALATADLNGDGRPDLAFIECPDSGCTYNVTYSVVVILGKGGGKFGAPKIFAAPRGCYGLHIADLNGDGIPDVVASSGTDSTVAVFLGKGNGNLQHYDSYQVGGGPQTVIAADVNNDGKVDLITADRDGNLGDTVSVLLNIGQPSGKPAAPNGALFRPSR